MSIQLAVGDLWDFISIDDEKYKIFQYGKLVL